jgi:hypothetical protein
MLLLLLLLALQELLAHVLSVMLFDITADVLCLSMKLG